MDISQGYYLFSYRNEYYLYDFQAGVIIQTNNSLYMIIRKYYKNQELRPEEQCLIDDFLACNLLQRINDKIAPDPLENEIAYLSFAPTYNCNFRCTYCFGNHGKKYTGFPREFTNESLQKTLNYFFNDAFPNAKRYRIDFVSGGEPLLGESIIRQTVNYIERKISPYGKKVSLWLCTNASLLTEEIIEWLSTHNVAIGVSIDGRKQYNDAYRVDASGNGTYERICRGIALIKNGKNVSRKTKNIWGLCTATNENCDFIDILEHMESLGFQHVQIRLIRSEKKYNVDRIVSEYTRLADTLFRMFSNNDLKYFRMIINDNDQFGKVLKRVILNHILLRRCNAAVNKITICPDGTIYPCDSLVGEQRFSIGNIYHNMLLNFSYRDVTVDSINRCRTCEIKYLCGGDCYYNSYMKTNSLFEPDPEFCKIQRHIIELSIMLRYKIEKENIELYNILLAEVKRKHDYSELHG